MDKVNWGILAPGHISRGFTAGLKVLDDAVLYAVASRDKGRAESFAREFGFLKAYGSYAELARDPEVDVIYIASPHHLHFENTLMCLENGKAVLCEKPFTINLNQLEILVQTARTRRIFLMEALWTRFLPHILKVDELIKSNKIGRIRMLTADFGFRAQYDPGSRLFNPVLGGGSLLDIGIYPVFLSLLLLGYPDEIKATSIISETQVDQSVVMSLAYKDGAMANLNCTFMAHTNTEAKIYGDLGKIEVYGQWFRPSSIKLSLNDGWSEELTFPVKANGYEYEAIEVMNCLRNGVSESDVLSLDFSLLLMKLLDDIRKQCNIIYPLYDK